jgi:mannose/cellobiose epimerase-like protein (N-acyl-D-glucosamine 2-epimerase family)
MPETVSWLRSAPHRDWLGTETGRLLAFARASRDARGGFAWLDEDGAPDPGQPRFLYVTARMTFAFALGHLLGRPGCGPLADHGLAALRGPFRDAEHGGWYAALGDDGPQGTDKTAYEHAFVLLAASAASLAERPGADALLTDAAQVVARRFWSDDEGLCRESWDRAWQRPEPYRGANANMHMTEACLAAADATGDDAWQERARSIAEHIVHGFARESGWRVPEHYDARWRPLPDYNEDAPRHPFRPYGHTPGHGLEWARLLLHVRAAWPDAPGWLLDDARALFDRAVQDGWDAERGGFAYTTDAGGRPVVRDRFHWVVAEGIGAAAALHGVTEEEGYERWYRTFWDFAGEHLLDLERGSWRHELDEANAPASATWPGKPDVYHALQATLVPRLPLAPSFAAALRRGLLA